MKVTCLRDNLREGLGIVGRAVATKSALPVLANVLLAAERGRLRLAATNLEMGVISWIGCQVEAEGSITVPARLLTDLVSNLPEEEVHFQADARSATLHVVCGSVTAQIRGIDAEEFPIIPRAEDEEPQAVLQAGELAASLKQVLPAVATDETRPALAGVLWRLRDSLLTLVGADGYRLALRSVRTLGGSSAASMEPQGTEEVDVIVPRKSVEELVRIAELTEGTVQATVTSNQSQILFQTDRFDMVSRLIDARYPDYERILPESYKVRARLDTEALSRAVKIASFFLEDRNAVKLQVQGGAVVVGTTATERGATSIPVDAVVEGDALEIAFNYRYLLDALTCITTKQLALEFEDPARPAVVRPVGSEGYLHLIMPIYTS